MLHTLVNDIGRTINQLLYHSEEEDGTLPAVRLGEIVDDLAKEEVGYWFGVDPSNPWLQDNNRSIVRHIRSVPQLNFQWFRGTDSIDGLNPDTAQSYLTEVERLRGLFLIAIHLLSGLPARTTELLSVQHQNTKMVEEHLHSASDGFYRSWLSQELQHNQQAQSHPSVFTN